MVTPSLHCKLTILSNCSRGSGEFVCEIIMP